MKYDITVVKKIELKKKSTSLIDKKRSVYLIMLNNSYKVKKKLDLRPIYLTIMYAYVVHSFCSLDINIKQGI